MICEESMTEKIYYIYWFSGMDLPTELPEGCEYFSTTYKKWHKEACQPKPEEWLYTPRRWPVPKWKYHAHCFFEAYGKLEKGYEVIDFRIPLTGELYRNQSGMTREATNDMYPILKVSIDEKLKKTKDTTCEKMTSKIVQMTESICDKPKCIKEPKSMISLNKLDPKRCGVVWSCMNKEEQQLLKDAPENEIIALIFNNNKCEWLHVAIPFDANPHWAYWTEWKRNNIKTKETIHKEHEAQGLELVLELHNCKECYFCKELPEKGCDTRHACFPGYWQLKKATPTNLPEGHLALPLVVKNGNIGFRQSKTSIIYGIMPGTISIPREDGSSVTLYGFCFDDAHAWSGLPLDKTRVRKWALFRKLEETL